MNQVIRRGYRALERSSRIGNGMRWGGNVFRNQGIQISRRMLYSDSLQDQEDYELNEMDEFANNSDSDDENEEKLIESFVTQENVSKFDDIDVLQLPLFSDVPDHTLSDLVRTKDSPLDYALVQNLHDDLVSEISDEQFLQLCQLVKDTDFSVLVHRRAKHIFVNRIERIINVTIPTAVRTALKFHATRITVEQLTESRKKLRPQYSAVCNDETFSTPMEFRKYIENKCAAQGKPVYKLAIQDLPLETLPKLLIDSLGSDSGIYASEVFYERCRLDNTLIPMMNSLKPELKVIKKQHKMKQKESTQNIGDTVVLKRKVVHGIKESLRKMKSTYIYGFLYFDSQEDYNRMLVPHLNIFGINLLYRMCYLSKPSRYLQFSHASIDLRPREVQVAIRDMIASNSAFGEISPDLQVEMYRLGEYAIALRSHEEACRVQDLLYGKSLEGRKLTVGFLPDLDVQRFKLFS